MALIVGVPLLARPDRSLDPDGEEPARYLVYVAATGDGGQLRGQLPPVAEAGDRVRIVAVVRLGSHSAAGHRAESGPGRTTEPDLERGVRDWLRRRPRAPAAVAPGDPYPPTGGVALLADGDGRVVGEATRPPWTEMPPSLLSPISTDIKVGTWGKVKELFR